MYEDDNDETIGMLLDIEHLYGQHEGRMAPVMLTLILISVPILLYLYFGAYMFFPIWLFVLLELVYSLRIVMLIPGRERHRVKLYKRQINDEYTSTADLLNIKTVHEDGCIEYINGKICYLVCCFNGTTDDEISRSIMLRKFLESVVGDFEFDTYIHNLTDSPALRDYYNKVKNFNRNESASNFVGIIDHNVELTENTSTVQCTIYSVTGYRSDWKTIKTQIDTAISSSVAKCYKLIRRLDSVEDIESVINRDVDSVIHITELMRKKYSTSQYASSKVIAYDVPEGSEVIQGRDALEKVIEDVAPRKSFHVEYKGGKDVKNNN